MKNRVCCASQAAPWSRLPPGLLPRLLAAAAARARGLESEGSLEQTAPLRVAYVSAATHGLSTKLPGADVAAALAPSGAAAGAGAGAAAAAAAAAGASLWPLLCYLCKTAADERLSGNFFFPSSSLSLPLSSGEQRSWQGTARQTIHSPRRRRMSLTVVIPHRRSDGPAAAGGMGGAPRRRRQLPRSPTRGVASPRAARRRRRRRGEPEGGEARACCGARRDHSLFPSATRFWAAFFVTAGGLTPPAPCAVSSFPNPCAQ